MKFLGQNKLYEIAKNSYMELPKLKGDFVIYKTGQGKGYATESIDFGDVFDFTKICHYSWLMSDYEGTHEDISFYITFTHFDGHVSIDKRLYFNNWDDKKHLYKTMLEPVYGVYINLGSNPDPDKMQPRNLDYIKSEIDDELNWLIKDRY